MKCNRNNSKKNTNKRNNKNKGNRSSYGRETLLQAISEVRSGESVAATSKVYNVPESTIRARVQGKYEDKKPGPSTILSAEEESSLVQWILHCAKQDFPVTKLQLLESVQLLVFELKRPNPFTNGVPGRHWFEGFLRRHNEISKRLSENVAVSRAKVTEAAIRKWFQETKNYLESEDLLNIHQNRIFNCDETGVALNPVNRSVLAQKGSKNVYKIVDNNEKENVTVLITANAEGELAPPLLLSAGKKMPPLVQQTLPDHFSAGISDHGWMTAKNFYEYIANVFYPWLIEKNIEFPVILFIDGHSSHVTLPLSTFCCEHKIILIALKANSTHILQPLDVAFFRTFKSTWQQKCAKFCRDNKLINIRKNDFAEVLNTTLANMPIKTILRNGFEVCGIYPFNENAVDYSKVFYRISENPQIEEKLSSDSVNKSKDLDTFERLLDKEKLLIFKSDKCRQWCGKKEDENLFLMWFDLASSVQKEEDNIKQRYDNTVNEETHYNNQLKASIENNTESSFHFVTYQCENYDVIESNKNSVDQNVDYTNLTSKVKKNTEETLNYVTNQNEECISLQSYEVIEHDFSNISISGNTNINKSTEQPQALINIVNEKFPHTDKPITIINSIESVLDPVVNEIQNIDPLETSQVIEHDSLSQSLSNNISINESAKEPQSLVNVVLEKFIHADKTITIINNIESVLDRVVNDIQNIVPVETSQLGKRSPLSNLNKLDNQIKMESPPAFQKILFWPDDQLEIQKKQFRQKQQLPSVLTSAKWREIKINQQEKRKEAEEAASLRKKTKLEKSELQKVKKEQMILNKIKKEELQLEKENKKLQKQKERIQYMENEKRKKEEELKKKKEFIQMKIDLDNLKSKEEELIKKRISLNVG